MNQGSSSKVPETYPIGDYSLSPSILEKKPGEVILRATHIPSGKVVAIKMVDFHKYRFKSFEAELVLMEITKKNPFVVSLMASFTHESHGFFCTKLWDLSLRQWIIKNRNLLPTRKMAKYFQQICFGVYLMHCENIAHRLLNVDTICYFKKENVMRVRDLSGAYRHIYKMNRDTKVSLVSGNLRTFASPESLEEQPNFSPIKEDVWSLGVILLCMLTGHILTESENPRDNLEVVEELLIPESVDLLKKMLEKSPNDRPTLDEVLKHAFFSQSNPTFSQIPLDLEGGLRRLLNEN